MPKWLMLLCGCLCSLSVQAQSSVWKISKGEDFVVLAGTIHLMTPAQYPLPSEFDSAYQQTQVLMLETDLGKLQDDSAMAQIQQHLLYPAGSTLSSKLSKDTLTQLQPVLQKFQLQLSQVDSFKPGMLAAQLTQLALKQQGFSAPGVDQYWFDKAKQDGKPLQFLETVEFQLQLLGGLGAGREDTFVRYALSDLEQGEQLLNQLLAAWRTGNVTFLAQQLLNPMQQADPESYRQMFVGRNLAWLPIIEALFANKDKEMVLVGAGHLAGEQGMLALLQAAGYRVEHWTQP